MSQYGVPRFRTTGSWPGSTVPQPKLLPLDHAEADGEWIIWPAQSEAKRPSTDLPPDFYLRELLDLSGGPVSMNDVVQLAAQFGLFCLPDSEDLEPALRVTSGPSHVPPRRNSEVFGLHRSVVELHLRIARRAVEIWIASKVPGGLADYVERTEILDGAPRMSDDDDPQLSDDEARGLLIQDYELYLERTLNAALSRFSVGVGDLTTRYPTIYSVCFLQIYNHMTERAVVRTCAREYCRRNFVRHRGRGTDLQYRRTGIKYCSRECARAQAQVDLRRRRRAEQR